MILGHVWGLFLHPHQEWEVIRSEPCSVSRCYLRHVLLLAALPAVSGFIGTTQIGWQVGSGGVVKLTSISGLMISVAFYLAMLVAVLLMGLLIEWMAETYGSYPNRERSVVLAAYTATPLFLVGVLALYPLLWVNMLVGLVALAYSIYLLYTGVPILMRISREQGFLFSSAILTVGLVMLVGMLAATVILWSIGVGPAFV